MGWWMLGSLAGGMRRVRGSILRSAVYMVSFLCSSSGSPRDRLTPQKKWRMNTQSWRPDCPSYSDLNGTSFPLSSLIFNSPASCSVFASCSV